MKGSIFLLVSGFAIGANAQNLEKAYDRDTNEQFKLKAAKTESVVKGPIVKQKTIFTFDNPYKKLTEASVWFSLDWGAVLNGFAYWYKDEYVPGVLMDKNKAWFIYTAITSRNEDPGIMVQTSPSSYHAQVYPLAVGYDFRLELDSVAFLSSDEGKLVVPNPTPPADVKLSHSVRAADPSLLSQNVIGDMTWNLLNYPTEPGMDLKVYAQRHKDGYTYVAGILRTSDPDVKLRISGMHNVYWTRPETGDTDGTAKLFIGRRRGAGPLTISTRGASRLSASQYIKANERGSDAAKLWAHQKLVQDEWRRNSDVLKFSLKYQVPSTQTALLAVPQEQMALFKKKEAEFRRKAAEDARKKREWQKQRKQNWNRSSGGDPEIRVQLADAVKAYAVLPDGRTFDLFNAGDGYWGGNYDIPANAPEGEYRVRIIGVKEDGTKVEQTIASIVDRTAPTGTLKVEGGFLVLRSEPKLASATVVFGDGTEEMMKEVSPGVYKLPMDDRRVLKVVLVDWAHNLRDIPWSVLH